MKSFHQNTILERVDCILVYTDEQVEKYSRVCKHVFTLKSLPKEVAAVVRKAKAICIHPDGFDHWFDILEVLNKQQPLPIKLFIFAGSDFTIEDEHIEIWAAMFPGAKFWIQNYLGSHERCRIFPIGVNKSIELSEKEKTKPLVISHFNAQNSEERSLLQTYLEENKDMETYRLLNVPIEEFLDEIGKGFFSVCPQGNGYDSYRFWESLSVGSIPLVLTTPFVEKLMEQHPEIPFMILNEWSDLSSFVGSDIEKVYDAFMGIGNLDILTEEYWSKEFACITETSHQTSSTNTKGEVSPLKTELSKTDEGHPVDQLDSTLTNPLQ